MLFVKKRNFFKILVFFFKKKLKISIHNPNNPLSKSTLIKSKSRYPNINFTENYQLAQSMLDNRLNKLNKERNLIKSGTQSSIYNQYYMNKLNRIK